MALVARDLFMLCFCGKSKWEVQSEECIAQKVQSAECRVKVDCRGGYYPPALNSIYQQKREANSLPYGRIITYNIVGEGFSLPPRKTKRRRQGTDLLNKNNICRRGELCSPAGVQRTPLQFFLSTLHSSLFYALHSLFTLAHINVLQSFVPESRY